MNGILLINKEINKTSRDMVNDISHIFHTKKVGHTGTLDPLATGVLVVTIGKYTKLNDVLTSTYKEYIAEFKFGLLTDTLDITGTTLSECDPSVSLDSLKDALEHFLGEYNQEVPIYSSVKVNGRKLYEYARNNESIELPSRVVDIKELELLSYENGIVKIRTLVSKGTYIRSLIRDIGEYLNNHATMTSLIRTKQGKFDIESTSTIEEVRNNNYILLSIEDVLDVEVIECSEALYKLISNGVKLENRYNKEYVLFKYNNQEISLYHLSDEYYRMFLKLED
jgi:tRNA pseudouridine55 synthase